MHERALFTLIPPQHYPDRQSDIINRRSTVPIVNHARDLYRKGPGFRKGQGQGSAVITLLDDGLAERINKEGLKEGKERGELDVDLLLQGAEKLCGI